jgi:hypothetical protein
MGLGWKPPAETLAKTTAAAVEKKASFWATASYLAYASLRRSLTALLLSSVSEVLLPHLRGETRGHRKLGSKIYVLEVLPHDRAVQSFRLIRERKHGLGKLADVLRGRLTAEADVAVIHSHFCGRPWNSPSRPQLGIVLEQN